MPSSTDIEKRHPIQIAARYSGLSLDLVRAWEKRYSVVQPIRANNGKRLYSDTDIQHLTLLKQVTQFGRRIGDVAHLSTEALADMAKHDEDAIIQKSDHQQSRLSTGSVMEYFDRCTSAVVELDAHDLYTALNFATEELGIVFFLEDLISPLLHHVEEECREGSLLNCHRRMFMEIIHSYLVLLCTRNKVAIECGIVCSMGKDPLLTALRTAVATNNYGWNSIYLGEQVTCNEIANALSSSKATAVIISFDGTDENALVPNEMRRLASLIENHAQLIINAPDISTYSSVLTEHESVHTQNLGELRLELEKITTSSSKESTTLVKK